MGGSIAMASQSPENGSRPCKRALCPGFAEADEAQSQSPENGSRPCKKALQAAVMRVLMIRSQSPENGSRPCKVWFVKTYRGNGRPSQSPENGFRPCKEAVPSLDPTDISEVAIP